MLRGLFCYPPEAGRRVEKTSSFTVEGRRKAAKW
jgi:hypothetical protein